MSRMKIMTSKKDNILIVELANGERAGLGAVDTPTAGTSTLPFSFGLIPHNDDFKEARASAITGGELKQRMYQRIDAWQWK